MPHSLGGPSVASVASRVLAPVTLLYKCCKCTAEGMVSVATEEEVFVSTVALGKLDGVS